MYRNYLITALRNIARHKLYSFISIAGLAVGLACVALIILFVRDELSYDKWVPGAGNLYRVEMTLRTPSRPPLAMAVVPFPMPEVMHNEIPGVTGMVRIVSSSITLTTGSRQFLENAMFVDPGFFKLIQLPLIAGDSETVFREPESIVLSQAAARKYFGSTSPIGRILTTNRSGCSNTDMACQNRTVSLKVTGVMADLPLNTQLAGDAFIPNTSIADRTPQDIKHDWGTQGTWGFVSLASNTDPSSVVAQMGPILDREVTPNLKKSGIAMLGSNAYRVQLTPFTQVHLNSASLNFNMTPSGSWVTVYGLTIIGAMILLVACFNFTNLSTARAMLRSQEIGLRKTVGATRKQIVHQFLGEAVLIALMALILALAAVELLLPTFNNVLQKTIAFSYVGDWRLLFVLVAVAIGAGLLSGIYPAFILSAYRPSCAFKATGAGSTRSGLMRDLLVVAQFAVSIGLGIAAAVVFSQINFARNIDLGFQHNDVVFVGGSQLTGDQRRAIAQELRRNPGIVDVSTADRMPFQSGQATALVQIPGQPENLSLSRILMTPEFPNVFGMQLIAGRMLTEARSDDQLHSVPPDHDPSNDGRNIMINASAALRMGLRPQQAIGKVILFNHSETRIVGVLADSKIRGARQLAQPTAYAYIPDYPMDFAIRIRPDMTPSALTFIDHTWHAFSPNVAIQRILFSDVFDNFYRTDERQGRMFIAFVIIAILIACMGLFGLAAFIADRRTKEIGIRKVFGAGVIQIVWLLLTQFSAPALLANILAWPLAWYYLHEWLQGFAYRITLSPFYFVTVGLAALLIAWITVLSHALRVARANPIHALRYE
jgi:putative ABC transport system permease protein